MHVLNFWRGLSLSDPVDLIAGTSYLPYNCSTWTCLVRLKRTRRIEGKADESTAPPEATAPAPPRPVVGIIYPPPKVRIIFSLSLSLVAHTWSNFELQRIMVGSSLTVDVQILLQVHLRSCRSRKMMGLRRKLFLKYPEVFHNNVLNVFCSIFTVRTEPNGVVNLSWHDGVFSAVMYLVTSSWKVESSQLGVWWLGLQLI